MSTNIHELIRTEHYHPSLNAAVFDGPFRIYFSQPQEAYALKIYFQLQKVFEKASFDLKNHQESWYFVILLYPQKDLYELQTKGSKMLFQVLNFNQDRVILTHGQHEEEAYDFLIAQLSSLIEQAIAWNNPSPLSAVM